MRIDSIPTVSGRLFGAEKEGISKEFRHEIFAPEFAIRQPVHAASVPMYPRIR
jgi:hypothetical protein